MRQPHSNPWPAVRLLAGLFVVSAGCATAPRPVVPTPDEVAALEARIARDSADWDSMVRLGATYRQVRRPDDAARVLVAAVTARPNDAPGVLHLGLTYEDLGRYPEARTLYERYLAESRGNALKREIRARIPLIQRRELEAAVHDAIARETELAAAVVSQTTVAIFPFLYTGTNEQLQPLSRALAEMLSTDLSQTGRLQIVERAQVQYLLNELNLGATALVEPSTAAKSGRLLSAGRIVQGRITGDDESLRLQAAIVEVAGSPDASRTVEQQDALRMLFEIEKRLAFDIYGSLGVQLTAAERERVNQRPTENLQAVLAFGRGLEASDSGNYALAAREFATAARLDGSFAAARQNADRASQAAAAVATTTDQLAAQALGTFDPSASSLAGVETLVPGATGRDAAPEVLGKEGIGKQTILEIVIKRN